MQLVTIDCREVTGRPGVVLDDAEILDLAAAPSTLQDAQWIPQSVISVLAAGDDGRERIRRLVDKARDAGNRERLYSAQALLPSRTTGLMAPVRRPGLILLSRLSGPDTAKTPVNWIKSPSTAVGQGQLVAPPWPESEGLVVTPHLAAVLAADLHRGTTEAAAAAIAAYCLVLDFSLAEPETDSLQDWRRFVDSKQFPGASPMGPTLITADEFETTTQTEVIISVNGVDGVPRHLDLAELPVRVAELSRRYGFRPGDMVGFALPGHAADERPLRSGDSVAARLGACMPLECSVAFPG